MQQNEQHTKRMTRRRMTMHMERHGKNMEQNTDTIPNTQQRTSDQRAKNQDQANYASHSDARSDAHTATHTGTRTAMHTPQANPPSVIKPRRVLASHVLPHSRSTAFTLHCIHALLHPHSASSTPAKSSQSRAASSSQPKHLPLPRPQAPPTRGPGIPSVSLALAVSRTGTFFCVTKTAESLPRRATLVRPHDLAALKAYSAAKRGGQTVRSSGARRAERREGGDRDRAAPRKRGPRTHPLGTGGPRG